MNSCIIIRQYFHNKKNIRFELTVSLCIKKEFIIVIRDPIHMSALFEIIVFENKDMCDMNHCYQETDAIESFVNMCNTYVDPNRIAKDETRLETTQKTIIYTDLYSNGNPFMIMLIGPFTSQTVSTIRKRIDDFYTVHM